jgi:HEAT repeat protein
MRSLPALIFVLAFAATAQQSVRPKDVRAAAKAGSSAIPKLQEFLNDPSVDVRTEAVRQITEIGPPRSLDPLILATRDNDPEVQILATDGLVNFYLPGYVKNGLGASLRRAGTSIKGRFTDTNDQVIDPFITVRPDVIAALGKLVTSGGSADVRANGARAAGILRGGAAVAELIDATHSKNSTLIYEALVALEKIRDESAGPRIAFLLHDFDPKVQVAAIEAVGLLRDQQDLPQLIDVLNRTDNIRVKREALESMAMLPAESSRPIYQQYLHDKDEKLRAAAAEGYARLKNPSDLPMLEQAWTDEQRTSPRLSLAFAQAMLGKTELSEFSPLRFLINNLNSAAYNGIAYPFLVELARDSKVRAALYGPLLSGTRDEKVGLSRVLGRSGDAQSVAELQKLANDPDSNVAQAALTAVRNLQARL